jgi:hypothetical protein
LSPQRSITVLGATDSSSLFTIYTLEAEECARRDMDLVIALESEPVKSSGSPDHDKPRYILRLNMEEGHNFNSTNHDSSSLSYVDNGTIIATTGKCHKTLCRCIRQCGTKLDTGFITFFAGALGQTWNTIVREFTCVHACVLILLVIIFVYEQLIY